MDTAIDTFYNVVRLVQQAWVVYEGFILKKFPQAAALTVGGYVTYCVIKQYKAEGKQRWYWLHSFVSVCLAAFGGGTVAPVLLGKPAGVVSSDLYIPLALVLWYLIFYLGFFDVLYSTPAKFIWSVLIGVYRTHGAVGMVNTAVSTLKAGPLYPHIPVVGPIILASIAGSFGGFLPFDKGLSPLQKSTPWPLQAPFFSATFYLFMVKDTEGFIGNAFRAVFGNLTERNVIIIIGTMQILSTVLQNLLHVDTNLFTPVHKLLYLVFQVQGTIVTEADQKAQAGKDWVGWPLQVRETFESFVDKSRTLIVVAAIAAYATYHIPTTTLPAVTMLNAASASVGEVVTLQGVAMSGLSVGSSVGACQWAPFLHATEQCPPVALTLQEWRICNPSACSKSEDPATCDANACGSALSSAVDVLDAGLAKEVRYRLVLANGTLSDASLQPRVASYSATEEKEAAQGLGAPVRWSSVVAKYSSAAQLLKADDGAAAGNVKLFVGKTGELYLLSSAEHSFANSGTILDPVAVKGKLLWKGQAKSKCSGDAAEVVGLAVNPATATPELLCSSAAGTERVALVL